MYQLRSYHKKTCNFCWDESEPAIFNIWDFSSIPVVANYKRLIEFLTSGCSGEYYPLLYWYVCLYSCFTTFRSLYDFINICVRQNAEIAEFRQRHYKVLPKKTHQNCRFVGSICMFQIYSTLMIGVFTVECDKINKSCLTNSN